MNRQLLGEHAFGVVDETMLEYLPAGIIAEALVPAGLEASAHLMPSLINLRRMPPHELDALFDCLESAQKFEQPPPVALFVTTEVDAPEFVQFWNSMQLAGPQPNRQMWLRLHDPRVLHQLLRILPPLQREKLLGRSASLTYWVGNEWVTVQSAPPCKPGDDLARSAIVAPYAGASRWDWSRIELIGTVNRALLGAGVLQASALTRQGELAEHLIKRAKTQYGLVEKADLVEFAMRGLTTSDTFDRHPKVAGAIVPVAPEEESSLSDRFALLDPQIWNALRQPEQTH